MGQMRLNMGRETEPIDGPLVVNFAGGTNSTAALGGLLERGMRPDLIVFSDTGDEKPHTYLHIWRVQIWCESVGFPSIQVVRWERKLGENAGRFISISEQCETRNELPSKAYGYAGCTTKWKSQPLDAYVRSWGPAEDRINRGEKVTRFIGFDADEPHRFGRDRDTKEWRFRYLLVEWDWGREECVEAISRMGLDQPGKSSCFHCPNSTPEEVVWLSRNEPVLLSRSLEIERSAVLDTVSGLGRSYAWGDLVAACNGDDDAVGRLPPRCVRVVRSVRMGAPIEDAESDTDRIPCGCYDG